MADYPVGSGQTFATVQAALDQVATDEGATLFTEARNVLIYDGTYAETVIANPALRPTAQYRLNIQAATGNSAVILTNLGLSASVIDLTSVENVALSGFALQNRADYVGLSAPNAVRLALSEIMFSGSVGAGSAFNLQGGRPTYIRNCTFRDFGVEATYLLGTAVLFERCLFIDNYADVWLFDANAAFDACVFSGGGSSRGILIDGAETIGDTKVDLNNCTFYNMASVLREDLSSGNRIVNLHGRNNIFTTVTTFLNSTDNLAGGVLDFDYNYYHSITAFCNSWKGSAKTTLAEWQAITDDDGNSPDANSVVADPLLTDPANEDFSLQDGSPCIGAGVGASVYLDVDGDEMDPYHPDLGATRARGPYVHRAAERSLGSVG